MKPYCFVLMPFGRKESASGKSIEFDKVYKQIFKPAIQEADLEPIRADEEWAGGIIHKPMFERLMLCNYAVADLTTANPNVLYELGVRHGIRPHSTVLTFAEGMRLPFDVKPLRGIPYELDSLGFPKNPEEAKEVIRDRLIACRDPNIDSPLFQLVSEMPQPDISHLKTDTFRDLAKYSEEVKNELEDARSEGPEAVSEIEEELKEKAPIKDTDPGIVIDLLLSYRAVKNWQKMVDLVEEMSPELSNSILVREQKGLALNRLGEHDKAERILKEIIEESGPSPETNGILGRVYKDLWEKAKDEGKTAQQKGYLKKAVDTYLDGFEADWRDAYPGVNAVTLMEVGDEVDDRQPEVLPVVKYSVKRRLDNKYPEYWDYATLLELHVIAGEKEEAEKVLSSCITEIRESWEPETTARNLRLLKDAKESRGEDVGWVSEIIETLEQAGEDL